MEIKGMTDREDGRVSQILLTAQSDNDIEAMELWVRGLVAGDAPSLAAIGVEVKQDKSGMFGEVIE